MALLANFFNKNPSVQIRVVKGQKIGKNIDQSSMVKADNLARTVTVNVYSPSTDVADKKPRERRTLKLQADFLSAQGWIKLIDINYNYTSS